MTQRFVDKVVKSAKEAGLILLSYREKGFSISSKDGMEFVTEADISSENYLREALTYILPEASFLGEESWDGTYPTTPCWVVDPLDGTNNYAMGIPFFCVSIALVDEDGVCLGCIHDPVHSETFTALREGGAYLNGKPIKVSSANKLRDAVVATGFPYTRTSKDLTFDLNVLTDFLGLARGIRRCGSAALDLAYTAAGRYGGFWEETLKPWDMAAGVLLVKEAGGKVTGFREKDWTLKSGGVQCSAPGIWDQFCGIINYEKRPRNEGA
ncbi:MAG: inositol monophosphatase [Candidatus Sabulitectum sp.]|nr:inositol monophosphatase [Candidatus Sabulitectum sp.]